ncbi:ketosteroid isomerase-like protein [Stella humosa]|uniref:Ketosteroid isomerase-like protein n=1 Tax=Stella humosa TaxID=94 RepID=A0A3N1KM16_9PROT|nr:nuclear transport factor 2 family protein [Stella humosa]ROP81384.1 ketosteroid isomerase-like protein [Stella humosa]BBK32735.1 ketosteroid isomerase [Stella humosa]
MVTLERLKEVGVQFARRDVEGIVGCFAEDGVFRNAVGAVPEGESYQGHAAIRAFFTGLFQRTPDVRWDHTAEYVTADRGVTEWRRTATLATGERQEWLGCDLYTFKDGMIVLKDTYIKVVR